MADTSLQIKETLSKFHDKINSAQRKMDTFQFGKARGITTFEDEERLSVPPGKENTKTFQSAGGLPAINAGESTAAMSAKGMGGLDSSATPQQRPEHFSSNERAKAV